MVTQAWNMLSTTYNNNLPEYISNGEYLVPALDLGSIITQVIKAPTHMDNTI